MWLIHPVGWGIWQTSRMLIFFEPAIEDLASLIVPSFSIYEVFKWILQQRSENFATSGSGSHGARHGCRIFDVTVLECCPTES